MNDLVELLMSDPDTRKPGALHKSLAWTLPTKLLVRCIYFDTIDGPEPTPAQYLRTSCIRIATLVIMMEKASNPELTLSLPEAMDRVCSFSLTFDERQKRLKEIHDFCLLKFDRDDFLKSLKLDKTKRGDQATIRDFHAFANALEIKTLLSGNNAWMPARHTKNPKLRKFLVVLGQKLH
ncbi:hypothetical protein H9P43_006679 [Blastocladiella emersonii ATCC 22665]|nr:hypothetical protein H9P43_006679 [Blastocladiella emersonii ATCC 22665]